jgi:hypothetical protein
VIGLATPFVAMIGTRRQTRAPILYRPQAPPELPPPSNAGLPAPRPSSASTPPSYGPAPSLGPRSPLPAVSFAKPAQDPIALEIDDGGPIIMPAPSALDLVPPDDSIALPDPDGLSLELDQRMPADAAAGPPSAVTPVAPVAIVSAPTPSEALRPRRVSGEHDALAGQHVGLRFALASAELRDQVVVARTSDGKTREVPWKDLGGALARELRDAPPFPDTMFVDLVPRAGLPLRFALGTTVTFGGGEVGAGARADLRRVLAAARRLAPQAEIEAATAAFADRGGELPVWSLRDLAQYDARYRAYR